MWGTLELICIGFWFLGVGWLPGRDWRRFAALSVVVGLGMLFASARTALTGRTLVDVNGPVVLA